MGCVSNRIAVTVVCLFDCLVDFAASDFCGIISLACLN